MKYCRYRHAIKDFFTLYFDLHQRKNAPKFLLHLIENPYKALLFYVSGCQWHFRNPAASDRGDLSSLEGKARKSVKYRARESTTYCLISSPSWTLISFWRRQKCPNIRRCGCRVAGGLVLRPWAQGRTPTTLFVPKNCPLAPPPPLLYNTRCARAAEEVLAKESGQIRLHRQAEKATASDFTTVKGKPFDRW